MLCLLPGSLPVSPIPFLATYGAATRRRLVDECTRRATPFRFRSFHFRLLSTSFPKMKCRIYVKSDVLIGQFGLTATLFHFRQRIYLDLYKNGPGGENLGNQSDRSVRATWENLTNGVQRAQTTRISTEIVI